MMLAAVVREFYEPPRYQPIELPGPADIHDEIVEVVATALHPRVRSQADGSHYTSNADLPLVPGIDGVGRRADGSLVYFILPDTTFGAMAEQTVIDTRRSVTLTPDVDPIRIAAAMNPAMSSWLALTSRISFMPGQSVLVLGATGSAGSLAIQVAKHLGAGRVIAAGRGAGRLAPLGADDIVDLAAAPSEIAAELAVKAANVDVVLDYLWGAPTEAAIMPMLLARDDGSRLLSWVEIGSVAGADIALPSAALRQANIHFLGSGQGSLTARSILGALPSLVDQIGSGTFTIHAVEKPLADVESVWTDATLREERVVFTPRTAPAEGS